jgi:hypothetical protein
MGPRDSEGVNNPASPHQQKASMLRQLGLAGAADASASTQDKGAKTGIHPRLCSRSSTLLAWDPAGVAEAGKTM